MYTVQYVVDACHFFPVAILFIKKTFYFIKSVLLEMSQKYAESLKNAPWIKCFIKTGLFGEFFSIKWRGGGLPYLRSEDTYPSGTAKNNLFTHIF